MAGLTIHTTGELLLELASLLIVHTDNCISTCSDEIIPIGLVVAREQLVYLVKNTI